MMASAAQGAHPCSNVPKSSQVKIQKWSQTRRGVIHSIPDVSDILYLSKLLSYRERSFIAQVTLDDISNKSIETTNVAACNLGMKYII